MISRKLAKFLSYRYLILAFVFIVVAGGLLLLPDFKINKGMGPEQYLAHTTSSERYISSDELAERMIAEDPSILLIDVRSENNFKTYSLPGAIHIPMDSILAPSFEGYLNQETYDVVLYSNDTFDADMAWALCNGKGYTNLSVLEGGMNNWFKTIINPTKPSTDSSQTEIDTYTFRKGASMYFGVAYPERVVVEPVVKKAPPKKVVPKKKKKKLPIEGGC